VVVLQDRRGIGHCARHRRGGAWRGDARLGKLRGRRTVAWTPGGLALSFGRMLQDGIVDRYLADHCPEQRLKLCKHRHELPTDADVFFWSGKGSIFNNLGRFAGLGDEMSEIVVGSLRDYPLWQVELALAATAHQLTRVATGEGVVNTVWHTYWAIDTFAPRAAASMHAGAPAARRDRICRDQPHPPAGGAGVDAVAARDHAARLAPRSLRRPRDAGHDRDGGAARQCVRLRRAVEPA
jgi:hypothetical protein